MNKTETKKCIAVMQAFVDGEDVNCGSTNIPDPRWNWGDCTDQYNVIPFEPRYGERVVVSKAVPNCGEWYTRKFVVYHNGKYYCENPTNSNNLVVWDRCSPMTKGC